MPNLCAVFNESITGLCIEDSIDEDGKNFIESIFKSIGYVRNIMKRDALFTAMFGSGRLYYAFYRVINRMREFENITKEDKGITVIASIKQYIKNVICY